jgi:hypothetical protein
LFASCRRRTERGFDIASKLTQKLLSVWWTKLHWRLPILANQFSKNAVDMPAIVVAKTLRHRARDEQLVIGLGTALILHWDTVPDSIQDLLIDQAALVLDDIGVTAAQPELETLIRLAKAVPLSPRG